MRDLIAFLRARLDEDEKLGMADGGERDMHSWTTPIYAWGNDWMSGIGIRETRLHAELQAKRAILDLHSDRYGPERAAGIPDDHLPVPTCDECTYDDRDVPLPCQTVKLLALPYADHPDYQQEWRP